MDEIGFILRRAHEGSREAAEELVRRYGDKLRAIIRAYLSDRHLRDCFHSGSVCNRAWCNFLEHIRSCTEDELPTNPGAYLSQVAFNVVRAELRSRKQGRNGQTGAGDAALAYQEARDPSPAAQAARNEMIDGVRAAVEALPPEDRAAAREELDGLTIAQQAEKHGVSYEAQKKERQRFHQRLRKRWKGWFGKGGRT
jgi:RNA polymerase sigma factor (sigma-70 family)